MGNQAESGSGGGIALQQVNGSDVVAFPSARTTNNGCHWNSVVTNNIIMNNVAGWDGGGISLLDSLALNIVNNTIMSNDSTASSGVLFNTIGAPLASTQGMRHHLHKRGSTPCVPLRRPQPAGVVSIQNSAVLSANTGCDYRLSCPAGHYAGTTCHQWHCKNSRTAAGQRRDHQNRSFYIGVGALGAGTLNQQNMVALYNGFTTTAAPSQTATGSCPAASSYWDIGVRGDTGPTNHASTVTLESDVLVPDRSGPGTRGSAA